MPTPLQPGIQEFFKQFEEAGNTLDTEALAELFCDVFLNLDPTAVSPVPREAFLNALPLRERLFGSIGADGTRLVDIVEIRIDDLHSFVETDWEVRFAETAASTQPLSLRSGFLLRRDGDRWRIAVYLNHQDIIQIIRERSDAALG